NLGTALALVGSLDRIAGQYSGRMGDEQFRLFVELQPDAVDVLARSQEFFRDRDNTVFHVGFPQNFRQVGRVPNLQVSVSEDGQRVPRRARRGRGGGGGAHTPNPSGGGGPPGAVFTRPLGGRPPGGGGGKTPPPATPAAGRASSRGGGRCSAASPTIANPRRS